MEGHEKSSWILKDFNQVLRFETEVFLCSLNNVGWDIVVDICVDFPGLCIHNIVLFVVKIFNWL